MAVDSIDEPLRDVLSRVLVQDELVKEQAIRTLKLKLLELFVSGKLFSADLRRLVDTIPEMRQIYVPTNDLAPGVQLTVPNVPAPKEKPMAPIGNETC